MSQIIKKYKKIISVMIACYIIITTIFLIGFTIREKTHECTHDNCQICYDIELAKEIVHNKNVFAVSFITIVLSVLITILQIKRFILLNNRRTLISLKTENLN